MKPNDDHGDKRHLTMKHIEDAAKASEISVEEAVKNITKTMKDVTAEKSKKAA